MWIDFFVIFGSVWGRCLIDFASKLESWGTQNTKKLNVYVFAVSTTLPARSLMIDFLVNSALNLKLKTRPRRLPTSIKKSIEIMMQVGMVFGPPPGTVLAGFWFPSWKASCTQKAQFETKLGAKLTQKRPRNDACKIIQKLVQNSHAGCACFATRAGSLIINHADLPGRLQWALTLP